MSILILLLSIVFSSPPQPELSEYGRALVQRKLDARNAYLCSQGDAEACSRT